MSRVTSINDRKKGCLYGLAIGDALGAAVEFKSPGTFSPVTGYRGNGPHRLNPGEWTDDTSMALAMANSLQLGWEPYHQLLAYSQWKRTGAYSVNGRCFDIGCQTSGSLSRFQQTGQVIADGSNSRSGNGSIMRLAPAAISYGYNAQKLWESSATTHASPQCTSACRYMGAVLAALMHGASRFHVLSPDWYMLDIMAPTLDPAILTVARGSYRKKSINQIRGSGWVVESLEAALWSFYKAKSFREAILTAVNLGNDADTTGAVCGQFAGAFWGYKAIDKDLIDGLARKDMINKALNGLGVY